MVAACEAALDSPQFQPEARERIQAFLKLYARRLGGDGGTAGRRLRAAADRAGRPAAPAPLRRPAGGRRAAARPLPPGRAGDRLDAARAARLDPRLRRLPQRRRRGRGRAGGGRGAALARGRPGDGTSPRSRGSGSTTSSSSASRHEGEWARIGWPARSGLVLSRLQRGARRRGAAALPLLRARRWRGVPGAEEELHEEELFGPAEGLHATYRALREQVLEASWRAGRELSEPRLDTAIDVNRAIARYLELLKLAALAQRPGDEPTAEAIEAVNGLLRQVATPEQQAELDASSLDAYLLDSERERGRRLELVAAREEPSLEAFLPRRGDGKLSLSASDLSPLPHLPAQVQVRPRLRHPAGADDQPALRDPLPQRPRALPQGAAGESPRTGCAVLNRLFEAGWRRTGFGSSDDELQFRDRAREALRLYWERERDVRGRTGLAGEEVRLQGRRAPRPRPGRPRRPPARRRLRADRLQDRRAQERSGPGRRPAARPLPAGRPRGLGHRGRAPAATTTCSTPTRSPAPTRPDDAERVERTVLQVGEGILGQDFEPRPSPTVCSWCDYRLICPAPKLEDAVLHS